MTNVFFTHRALRDLHEIDRYSNDTFGQRVADEYMAAFDRAIDLLSERPHLLQEKIDVSGELFFYRVREHFLVCDVASATRMDVVTVTHGSRDLPHRIGELEPQLKHEVELMRRRRFMGREGGK